MFAEHHIVLRDGLTSTEFYCKGCGISQDAPVGLSIVEFNKVSTAFIDAHRACGQQSFPMKVDLMNNITTYNLQPTNERL